MSAGLHLSETVEATSPWGMLSKMVRDRFHAQSFRTRNYVHQQLSEMLELQG
jgi:Holliday junction resolvasome RuvABC ATP-dependent DNA helicase subunit